MHIKSIVIDGFKSYAQRTEINGFDPLFNAITGLNGSGKSNILDSICFLLGISNLSQVRAGNLQDLVYKSGQAGVTKATVSITFDNQDKNQTPLGYEQYDEITVTRQVIIGGRNKYLINGSNATNMRVQDLFQSVQLNVNNPHFLIMQGRITKVLNMKPPEILSMIEEAAGTRLYETKKEAAQRTIEKKDAKLRELDSVLNEDIAPTLTKLREERSSYLEYQKIIRQLEHLNKLYIAYQFVSAEERKKKSVVELAEMQENVVQTKGRMEEIKVKMSEIDVAIEELEQRKNKESGSVIAKLEADLAEKKNLDVKVEGTVNAKKDALKSEQKKQKEINKNIADNKASVASREKDLSKIEGNVEKMRNDKINAEKEYEAAKKHFQAVSAGLSSNDDGEAATLNDQLITAKSDISKAETDTKQAQMRLKHAQQEIKTKEVDLKKTDQDYKKNLSAYETLKANLTKLEAELKKCGYEEGSQEKLSGERRVLAEEVQSLKEKCLTLEARYPQLKFEYKDPEANFNRSKVSGLVCKLFEVKDPIHSTALEVTAGGKLYNVVVDNELTGKGLLQRGELKRRVTILPISKITSRPIDDATLKRAEALVGKGKVQTALSLISYDKKYQSIMEYTFGSVFICSDMDSASKVAYDPQIMKKCVTLEGDTVDPAGTLSGGARAQTTSMLAMLHELRSAEEKVTSKSKRLAELDRNLDAIKRAAGKYTESKQQYDLKAQEAEQVRIRLEQSSHHQQLEEVNALKASVEEQNRILKEAQEIQKRAQQKVKDLEDKLKNASALREKELKEADQRVTLSKKKMEEAVAKAKDDLQEVDSMKLEIETLQKEIQSYEQQLEAIAESIVSINQALKELNEEQLASKAQVQEAQSALKKHKEMLMSYNQDIAMKDTEKKDLNKELKDSGLKIQELEHRITKLQKDSKDANKYVEALLEKNDWIVDERKFFGQPNTVYDFNAQDPKEAEKQIQKLTETKNKLSKNVNVRAMNLLGHADEQYTDLMKKRKVVLKDKATITAAIEELDKKKKAALIKAWEQVNKDFGSIFSTLLPGTQAKLCPPENQTVLDGLEVKVAFGSVWKESLSELSGGQRSLVALSLILAMLLFKPAPIYILDEVDAALDLSHTQNIGQMIRSHFKHSQFIVVSLKDGMFNNANVLFRTKFVDGVSTVSRHAQNPRSLTSSSSSSMDKENELTEKRKRLRT
ncbi:structural maintenance of chromosomes protein 2-like [Biomphalaria glabrata]|uniref:Structural maintenance of chromosomes protein n=1 Tax=Biomphalaria glabrata TaxID=6526 RepID=A0A9W3AGE4_BIOGL|nr:structural maintenance of chromosomes protein 2-like [Biomphalaria glabrata]